MIFQQHLLEGVSRSFSFTIPQLPEPLRNVVTNSYLLFRVADTIEDENSFPLEQKKFFWNELIASLSENRDPMKLINYLPPLLSSNTSQAERELIINLNRVVHITKGFTEYERELIRRSITCMCEGMELFQKNRSPSGLRNLTELNNYCYYVAGVVGELLTELFCNYSPEISKKRSILVRFAISFGQGLQMTNILKDFWKDLNRGVCWLPKDIFEMYGFDLKDISQKYYYDSFKKGVALLIAITYGHLKNGMTYTLILPKKEKGIRKFCLWDIGLAIITLRNIWRRTYNPFNDIKVSRKIVKRIIRITQLNSRNNFLLNLLFYLGSIGLPKDKRSKAI